jgi:hypothetical protein
LLQLGTAPLCFQQGATIAIMSLDFVLLRVLKHIDSYIKGRKTTILPQ